MGLRILLVEDNALNQELARDLLESEGHEVAIARDGREFRERLARGGPIDLVLLDILLPDADGVTLVRELRAGADAALPAVALTAQALNGDVERFLGAGFDGVLTKPIDTRTFVAEVVRYARGGDGREDHGDGSDR